MSATAHSQESRSVPLLHLADLTIDRARAQVSRNGVEISLPRLSYDLLLALVDQAPAICTTEMLLDRVWPGLVVSPETVAQRIKLLRTALGDDARQPRYLAVVRGRGYRLVEPVVAESSQLPAPGVAETSLTTRRWAIVLSFVLAGIAILAGTIWLRPAAQRDRAAAPVATASNERSIAVLPFENLGAAPDDNALTLGIAESVLHQLANLPNMVVIARTSSFSLNRKNLDPRQVGARLGARFLLEGSVQHVDTQLRVTAQLIEAASGTHVWSLQFDRSTHDVFSMEDEIALKVAQALELSLDAKATERLSGQGTSNFDAYFEFVQARSLLAGGRVADMDSAGQHLQRAIRLDPDFARAYVELAGAELQRAEYDPGADRRSRFDAAAVKAGKLLEQAIALDPGNGR
ncbi:MAG TPA: winged helix-turn-helix domain-containing protein, partial [Steroidobacteraceae bacterium]|nr:winged helix-turn-helix domain-containing protein [Steroidobacteraceae bacterium]